MITSKLCTGTRAGNAACCDGSTGRVIGLHLSGNINSNSSLFLLTHLQKLSLSFNDFTGPIPVEFYHLSNLISLDLTRKDGTYVNLITDFDLKMLFGNVTNIRVLRLSNNYLNSSLPQNMSSVLTHLDDLEASGLHGMLPMTIFEKSKLEILNLGDNDLIGSLPGSLNWSNSIGFISNLKYMVMSRSDYSGPIPESIGNITGINYLDWSASYFSGQVPSTISSLRHLIRLDLSSNDLEGKLPDTFSGFENLTYLSFERNHLVGQIPSSLTNMSQLTYLSIASNALTGHLPSKAGPGLKLLWRMDLSNNLIQGTIPSWLFNLPSLQDLVLPLNRLTGPIGKINSNTLGFLDLSYNRLNIDLASFHNLTSITQLLISHNRITDHDREIANFTSFPNLDGLDLSSCEIKEFPKFLRSMPTLWSLDLSNNKIHGPIPIWFSSSPQDLYFLNLSTNFFTDVGYLPWPNLNLLDLKSNLLLGKFPSSICNMTSLEVLSLSGNKLSGNIPECIGNFSTLQVLDLRNNEFVGRIPSTIGVSLYELVHLKKISALKKKKNLDIHMLIW